MGTLLSYSIVSGIMLLCLYLVFMLTLSDKNQHGYNRGVALGIYAISFLAFPIKNLIMGNVPSLPGNITNTIEATASFPAIAVSEGVDTTVWGTVLVWIYCAGLAAVAAMTAWTWLKILYVIRHGERIKRDGYTLVLTDNESIAPFSWMRFIVMSRRDHAECGNTILTHERQHIALCHWIDLLIAQASIMAAWFNPATWLMRRELVQIHEYQADMAVLENGCNAKQYQMTLIEKAAGARFPSLANSLNHSNLKKRITMMYEKKSSKGQRLKALALVPATALALSLTAIPPVNAAITKVGSNGLLLGKVKENPETRQIKSSSSFQIQFDYRDGQTRISVTSEQLATAKASNPLLVADGHPYKPKNVNINVNDSTGTVEMNFGEIPAFESGTLSLDCGEKTMAISITGNGNEKNMATQVHISDDERIPDNAIVQTRKSTIKLKPGNSNLSITTSKNDGSPTEQRLTIDKSKVTDGVAYIYNGRQITKAEFEALDQSKAINIPASQNNGTAVMLILDSSPDLAE